LRGTGKHETLTRIEMEPSDATEQPPVKEGDILAGK
jgi:hypothetical protein